ncbi:hypothetical protein PPL_11193 [Heterostelium album PN500]|uniref:EGF-like domain-containing protein n=1 Tax=Heterostelium pallidum (strain ATCC 26659 / Pp 5 / PN500) TaxID=670386 RepID=D3BTT3_HETP5|nr:hypothetical protein PPL_11193 [Heterostelium album PN500]EFA75119.1 hypothetical protein PPL_11193 [Heterostelium album PN500]|eukprot:XP_020427253.1 hypothetical protein PPL_11193 [Heterostelium album PN500]
MSDGFGTNQSIATFLASNTVYTEASTSAIYFTQRVTTVGSNSYPTNINTVNKNNAILRWVQTSASSGYYTAFTLFPPGSATMSILLTPWIYSPTYQTYSASSQTTSIATPISSSSEVDFMVYEAQTLFDLFVHADGVLYQYSIGGLKSTNVFNYTASKTAIAYGSTLMACTSDINGAYIEKFNFVNGQHSVYNLTTDFSACLNMNMDQNYQQLFVSIADSQGNLALITTSFTGLHPTTFKFTPSEKVNTVNLNSYSYAVGVDNSINVVRVASGIGQIYTMTYKNLCPNQCNNHGQCFSGACICSSSWLGDDCSVPKPFIYTGGTAQVAYLGTTVVTITGESFVNTPNNKITICGGQCLSMVFVSAQSIICTLTLYGNQTNSPFDNCDITVSFNGYSSDTEYIITYATPTLSEQYFQVNDTLVFNGTNMYNAANFQVRINQQTPVSDLIADPYSLSFKIPAGSHNFNLDIFTTNTWLYSGIVKLVPYLTSINPSSLQTASGYNITLSGDFFQSNDLTEMRIYIGDDYVNGTVVDMNTVIFPNMEGIIAKKIIRAYDDATYQLYSNSLAFVYSPPTIVSTNINQTDNTIISIQGNNFGSSGTLISFAISNSEPIAVTFISVTHNIIIFKAPSTIFTAFYHLTVDDQAAATEIPLLFKPTIQSVSNPHVTGGNLTIVGNYIINSEIYFSNIRASEQLISPCVAQSSNNIPATIICQVEGGAGDMDVVAVSNLPDVGTLYTPPFESKYQAPSISNISPAVYFANRTAQFTIFGDNFYNSNIIVKINDEECNITATFTNNITCEITSLKLANETTNPVPVFVSVESQNVFANNTVAYYGKWCLNDCSQHGTCNYETTVCKCDIGWRGNDCSEEIPVPSTTTSTPTGGATTDATTGGATTTGSTTSDLNSSSQLSINILAALLSFFNQKQAREDDRTKETSRETKRKPRYNCPVENALNEFLAQKQQHSNLMDSTTSITYSPTKKRYQDMDNVQIPDQSLLHICWHVGSIFPAWLWRNSHSLLSRECSHRKQRLSLCNFLITSVDLSNFSAICTYFSRVHLFAFLV